MILNASGFENSSLSEEYKIHNPIAPHNIDHFGDLSKGVEYNKEIFEDENAPLFKMGIEYNDYNPDEVFDTKNRVLYQGELIYVEEYTRSDGTKVSGYYRAYPRK